MTRNSLTFVPIVLCVLLQWQWNAGCSDADARIAQAQEQWRLPGEFEPTQELLISWLPAHQEILGNVVAAVAPHAPVTLLVDPRDSEEETVDFLLGLEERSGQNFDIELVDMQFESIWIRDYGPLVVEGKKTQRVVDLPYFGGESDDEVAWRYSEDILGLEAVSITLKLEGGNLQADGQGRCLLTTRVFEQNPGMSQSRINRQLRRHFGCTDVHLLPRLPGEPTGHVDMFAQFTAPGEVIVGELSGDGGLSGDGMYEVREHLEFVARHLRKKGMSVRRVPMPEPKDGYYRTHVNSVVVNGVVLVPYYPGYTEDLEKVLRVFREAYPNREIVPIDSTELAEFDGVLHCMTMGIPAKASGSR